MQFKDTLTTAGKRGVGGSAMFGSLVNILSISFHTVSTIVVAPSLMSYLKFGVVGGLSKVQRVRKIINSRQMKLFYLSRGERGLSFKYDILVSYTKFHPFLSCESLSGI